ncbi:hypothetical protein AAG906_035831 [Vitis piasezkii]
MVASPVPPQTKLGELPTETIPPAPALPISAPPVPMLEATSVAPPMTPTVPPIAPTTSEPSITISASKFRPLAPTEDTIPVEDTTTVEVQISPPQEATTDAIASNDPRDEPQTIDTITATPEDASSPPEAATT